MPKKKPSIGYNPESGEVEDHVKRAAKTRKERGHSVGVPGKPQTAAQKSAAAANLEKGRAARAAKIAEAREKGEAGPTAGEKWAMLLSGTMSVKDMDDEELARCQFRNKDGLFGGAARTLPSNIVQQISNERLRRASQLFEANLHQAIRVLAEVMEHGEKDADRLRAAQMITERVMGKPETTVRVRTEDPWENLTADAIIDDRDLA